MQEDQENQGDPKVGVYGTIGAAGVAAVTTLQVKASTTAGAALAVTHVATDAFSIASGGITAAAMTASGATAGTGLAGWFGVGGTTAAATGTGLAGWFGVGGTTAAATGTGLTGWFGFGGTMVAPSAAITIGVTGLAVTAAGGFVVGAGLAYVMMKGEKESGKEKEVIRSVVLTPQGSDKDDSEDEAGER